MEWGPARFEVGREVRQVLRLIAVGGQRFQTGESFRQRARSRLISDALKPGLALNLAKGQRFAQQAADGSDVGGFQGHGRVEIVASSSFRRIGRREADMAVAI